jgi:hypothetical protein
MLCSEYIHSWNLLMLRFQVVVCSSQVLTRVVGMYLVGVFFFLFFSIPFLERR